MGTPKVGIDKSAPIGVVFYPFGNEEIFLQSPFVLAHFWKTEIADQYITETIF
jgi:hypothetical protein